MKLQQWSPDSPDFVDAGPVVDFSDAENVYPTTKGYSVMSSAVPIGSATLAGACLGAASVLKLAGTRRVFAATTDTIYELQSGSWVDVTTPALTAVSTSRYLFAQFGDATIATNDADQLMAATSGNFAAISNSPKAKIVFSVPNFVIALNTQDGSGSAAFGDSPDRWWCSGFQDHTIWTPNRTTLCQTGRLIGAGGELTAGAKFGNGFVAYKEREMWLATFNGDPGSPSVFDFQAVPGDVGCVGPEAVVDIGGAHVFVGSDNIWLYDGTRPRSIADGVVRDWFFSNCLAGQLPNTRLVFDRDRMLVWVFFNSAGSYSGYTTDSICYHLTTGRWGRKQVNAEAVFNYFEPGITWATVAASYPTWASMSGLTWGSTVWFPGGRTLAYLDTSHALQGLTGQSAEGSMSTKAIGLPGKDTTANEVVFRGLFPESSTFPLQADIASYEDTGALRDTYASITATGAKVRHRSTGRFHKYTVQIPPGGHLWGMDVKLIDAGNR